MRRLAAASAAIAVALAVSTSFAQSPVATAADLVAAFANGGDYEVLPGHYVVENPVVIRSDLRLIGSSPDEVLIEIHGAPEGVRIVDGATVRLEGLVIFFMAASLVQT